jgi:hypothetical protein
MKYIISWAAMVILSYGCGISPLVNVGQLATADNGFAEDFLPGQENNPDIIPLSVSIGESMGYKVYARNEGVVVLINQYTKTQQILTGNAVTSTIVISRGPNYSKAMSKSLGFPGGLPKGYDQNSDKLFPGLFIACSIHGSFGEGSNQNAAHKLDEFKKALLSRNKII